MTASSRKLQLWIGAPEDGCSSVSVISRGFSAITKSKLDYTEGCRGGEQETSYTVDLKMLWTESEPGFPHLIKI
jgi:hypothetical protein